MLQSQNKDQTIELLLNERKRAAAKMRDLETRLLDLETENLELRKRLENSRESDFDKERLIEEVGKLIEIIKNCRVVLKQ